MIIFTIIVYQFEHSKILIAPQLPPNEKERLEAVREYNLLDTLPEEDFDSITKLTASICDVPISLVTLLDADRNFIKSHYGIDLTESPRELSFCGHAILDSSDLFIVEDARKDERFHDNPLVEMHRAIFYAGVSLKNEAGLPIGTLCVFDNKPRVLSEKQKNALIALAQQVMMLFDLRKKNIQLRELQRTLEAHNQELKNFAAVVSHDMKMPLANMIVTADILKAKYGQHIDAQGLKYLEYLKQSSFTLSDYITGMLNHYESDSISERNPEEFDLNHLLEEIVELLDIDQQCEINFPMANTELRCNRSALEQIFLNLIGNSLKYNDKEVIEINIGFTELDGFYQFRIEDNGVGIPEEKIDSIFNLFTTVGNLDRKGRKGSGIGLSTVKKLVTRLGGTIHVDSKIGKGTTFEFSIKEG